MKVEISKFFASEKTPKFLATLNHERVPNVVLIASFKYFDERLIFGDFMIWKTKKNLLENKKVCVSALLMNLDFMTMKGDFIGFERSGHYVEMMNNIAMFRYNAYTGIRNAGMVEIKEIVQKGSLSKLSLLYNYILRPRAHNIGDGKLPGLIMDKFNRLTGIKVISFLDKDGYPMIIPAVSLYALDRNSLIFPKDCLGDYFEEGKLVACNVVTMEPVSYQVKGTLSSDGKKGIIHISEVYSAAPPLLGVRIDTD